LWSILQKYFGDFLVKYDDSYVREFGCLRSIIPEVVKGYLKCGDLAEGFARVRCPECHHEYLLAFSCRGRWFCPSCLSVKKITYNSATGTVIYKSKTTHRRNKGGRKNFQVFARFFRDFCVV